MKTILIIVVAYIGMFTALMAKAMPAESEQYEPQTPLAIEGKIETITDTLLRDATRELWLSVNSTPKSLTADYLFQIRLNVQSVAVFFDVFQVEHTEQAVNAAREVLKTVFKGSLAKLESATKRPGTPDQLIKEYQLIARKVQKICGKKSSVADKEAP